jgi:hypothetical protein
MRNAEVTRIFWRNSFLINPVKKRFTTVIRVAITGATRRPNFGTSWLSPSGCPYKRGTTGGRKSLIRKIAKAANKLIAEEK